MLRKAILWAIDKKYFFILIAAIFIWPLILRPNGVPMPRTYYPNDFIETHLPIAQYVNDGLFQYGQIPLWNIYQFSGQPMAADPLTGYAYLPNWLAYLLPIPFTINFLCWLHIAWSGLGLFTFLRKNKLHSNATLLASIAWMGTPKIIAYLGGGQISTIFALAWIPWLLVMLHDLTAILNVRNSALAGTVLAIIFLSDIRWGVYASLLAGGYFIFHIDFKAIKIQRLMTSMLVWAACLLVLTSVISLPLFEFMRLSRRSTLSLSELDFLSIQPTMLFGLLMAQLRINFEQITYLGILPLILAIFGIRKKTTFWSLTGIFCLLFSLGSHFFLFPLISSILPGMNWLRVPSRLWFFVSLVVCILSAYGLDSLLTIQLTDKRKQITKLLAVTFSAIAIMFSVGASILMGRISIEMVTMAITIPISFASIIWSTYLPTKGLRKLLPLIVVLLCDLVWVNSFSLTSVPLPTPSPIVEWLSTQKNSMFRVFSPSYTLPMPNLLQQANGVNPLHLNKYALFIGEASHISTGRYSVSLPDIYIDDKTAMEIKLAAKTPDTAMLGELNIRYMAADFVLTSPNLKLLFTSGNEYLYENLDYRERVWMEQGKAEITMWSPNAITIQTSGTGGQLILSEIDYPGWHAWIDTKPVVVETYDSLLRSVWVEPGNHTVVFAFRPIKVFLGAGISLLGWVILIIYLVRTKTNQHS